MSFLRLKKHLSLNASPLETGLSDLTRHATAAVLRLETIDTIPTVHGCHWKIKTIIFNK